MVTAVLERYSRGWSQAQSGHTTDLAIAKETQKIVTS
jgi:hypothetical protein